MEHDEVIEFLQTVEDESYEKEKYYIVVTADDEDNPLNGVIFKAKTDEGALLALYNYIQNNLDNKYNGREVNDIIELIDTTPEPDNLSDLATEFIDNEMHTMYKMVDA